MFTIVQMVAVVVVGLVYIINDWYKDVFRKMPGPRSLPLIGNLLQLRSKRPHILFTEWKQKYGDIFCIKIMNKYTVVLNSAEAIHEALVAKGIDFAGRPSYFRADQAFYGSGDIVFKTFSPKLKHMRKVGHWAIKSFGFGLDRLETIVLHEIDAMLNMMSEFKGQPLDMASVVYAATANIMTTIIIGEPFKTTSDEVKQVMLFDRLLSQSIHPIDGAELDAFPWLRFLGHGTFKKIQRAVEARDDFVDKQLLRIKSTLKTDNVRGIFDALLLNQAAGKRINNNNSKKEMPFGPVGILEDIEIKAIIGDLVAAGTITSSTAMTLAVLVLLHKPDIQDKLHQEIDKVVPRDRLPNYEDRLNLPYVDAFNYEVLRYMAHVPLSVPHYTMADTSVGGYDIPKGTQVVTNTWSVSHDERYYKDPWEFQPERFLDDDGLLVSVDHPARKNLFSFGAGRRICIGENLAKTRLFLMISAIMQKFDLVQVWKGPATNGPEDSISRGSSVATRLQSPRSGKKVPRLKSPATNSIIFFAKF